MGVENVVFDELKIAFRRQLAEHGPVGIVLRSIIWFFGFVFACWFVLLLGLFVERYGLRKLLEVTITPFAESVERVWYGPNR